MYDRFAELYDEFMDTADYGSWCAFIISVLKKHGIEDGLLLDLACGTGVLTEMLSGAGYDCIGVDGSFEMLQKAIEKRDVSGHDILYLNQDMRDFELYGTVRAVVCTCDSVNYLTEEDDLLQMFRLVNNYLDPGGIFLFDFNTEKTYGAIGESTIAETRDEGSFIWENEYDAASGINEYTLTLFIPEEGGLYSRHEEIHVQKAWRPETIRRLLREAGLIPLSAFDGYTDTAAGTESERIVVVAKESGKQPL